VFKSWISKYVLQNDPFAYLKDIDQFKTLTSFFLRSDIALRVDIYRYMKKKPHHISIRITKKQYNQLLGVLEMEGLTKSQLVRLALADFISKSAE